MDATSVVTSVFPKSSPMEKAKRLLAAAKSPLRKSKPTIEEFAASERAATDEDLDDDEIQVRYASIYGEEQEDDDEP